MSHLTGRTVPQRKKSLASLVEKHLNSLGRNASIIENRKNSKGHTDSIVVASDIGLIHLTATSNKEPNSIIPVAEENGEQSFLADKAYVAYGWNTSDARTIIMYVPASSVEGKSTLTKNEIRALKEFHMLLE